MVSADVVNTIFSGILSFSGAPIYHYYVERPNSFGISPIDDQVPGPVNTWVIGSLASLAPAMWITFRLLGPMGLTSEITASHQSAA